MKACTKCDQPKPLDQFAVDRAKRDGRDSWCRDCRNRARMDRYNASLDRERQRSRDYYAGHREEKKAYGKRYYLDHLEEIRTADRERWRRNGKRYKRTWTRNPEQERIKYMKRHGGIDEWARLYEAQEGCCYLCGLTLEGVPQRLIAVDHDHDCHPVVNGSTESCGACRRGLAHAWCNQIIGMVGEDMGMLRAIIANFEPVNAKTKQRIATRTHKQDELDLGLTA